MSSLLQFVTTVTSLCHVYGALIGPVTINEFGRDVTRYVVSEDVKLVSAANSTITLQHDAGLQIAAYPNNSYSPNMFARYNLDVCFLFHVLQCTMQFQSQLHLYITIIIN